MVRKIFDKIVSADNDTDRESFSKIKLSAAPVQKHIAAYEEAMNLFRLCGFQVIPLANSEGIMENFLYCPPSAIRYF